MKIKPLYDRIIVLAIESNRTPGGLYMPDNAHPSIIARGEVLAVGTGMVRDGSVYPLTVQVGDVIMFGRPGAQAIPYAPHDDGTVFMLREPEVMGILTELERDTGLLDDAGNPVLTNSSTAAMS